MKKRNKFTRLVASVILSLSALCLFFVSCSKDPEPEIVKVTSVALSKSTLELVEGETETLKATVAPENAANKRVAWKSGDMTIAAVDAEGKIVAVKPGNATITVTSDDGSKTATCAVTVKAATVSVTGVTLNKTTLSLVQGTNETLTVTVAPENATNKKVTWKSDKADIATVDANGKVTAAGVGTATITVTTEDAAKTATCLVTVTAKAVAVTGVKLNKTSLSLVEGASETLTATVAPENATNKKVTWKSSDLSIAIIDSDGHIAALKPGVIAITATTEDGGKTATCAVTVTSKAIAVTGVSLNKTSLSLVVGESETLTPTVAPADADNKKVSWKSNNTSVATVDNNGNVTALKAGSATITATTEDGGKTATCAVTVTAPAAVPMFNIGAQTGDGGDGILDSGTMEWVKYSLTGANGMTFTGKTADIAWFSDAEGNNSTTEPIGVRFAILKFPGEDNNIVSLGASVAQATPEGSYYFRIIIEGVTSSNVGVLKVGKAWEMKINNVTWAARNVERPALFVSNPEDTGWYYQRNRYTGWSPTDPLTPSHDGEEWNSVVDTNDSWVTRNNPCPAGYRLPTLDDINALLDKTSVDREWVTQNGVKGYKFTDKKSGNTLFIPAGGNRDRDGKLSSPEGGRYMTSTYEEDTARKIWSTRTLYFDRNEIRPGLIREAVAYTIRCVKK
ncbi:Ig-like domain-containing protein [Parabacteroides sp. OttesenSCG-928-B22]|nr:Ig-like domain-containing protein [Parabacteroides sp. OttesenSCG-928-B22]